ncbi:MAG: hypothetical protein ACREBB_04555 [Nitrosotalea sp.]
MGIVDPLSKKDEDSKTSVTFRIDSDKLQQLKKEADHKEISLNTLVGQIFRQHIGWHSNAPKAGFVSVTKGFISNLLSKTTEKEILKLAEYAVKKETKDFVLLLRNEYDITSVLDVLETRIQVSGFQYRHEVNGTVHSYVIQHDMGRKWSDYMAAQYRYIFGEFKLKPATFEMTDNTLAFVVNLKDR